MKLNIGCGNNKKAGYVNIDVEPACNPDQVLDICQTPWPFPESSVEEIVLCHVLEHVGRTPEEFKSILRELYRVLQPDGLLKITVPHPSHDTFSADSTHVRPITIDGFRMFSKALNEQWQQAGSSATPLALYWNIDFEITEVRIDVDKDFASWAKANGIKVTTHALRYYRNAIRDLYFEAKAVKR